MAASTRRSPAPQQCLISSGPAIIVEISRSALALSDSKPEQLIDLLAASRYAVYRIDATVRLVALQAGEPIPDGDVVVALPVGVRVPFA